VTVQDYVTWPEISTSISYVNEMRDGAMPEIYLLGLHVLQTAICAGGIPGDVPRHLLLNCASAVQSIAYFACLGSSPQLCASTLHPAFKASRAEAASIVGNVNIVVCPRNTHSECQN
jgi:hypothetical protein